MSVNGQLLAALYAKRLAQFALYASVPCRAVLTRL
jgi:hypothetical protein